MPEYICNDCNDEFVSSSWDDCPSCGGQDVDEIELPDDTESPTPTGQAELPCYVLKGEHEKVCKTLNKAEELLHTLLGSGCLDMERSDMIRSYFGVKT
jgi:hypothetical protein